jgi:hypothetical protein
VHPSPSPPTPQWAWLLPWKKRIVYLVRPPDSQPPCCFTAASVVLIHSYIIPINPVIGSSQQLPTSIEITLTNGVIHPTTLAPKTRSLRSIHLTVTQTRPRLRYRSPHSSSASASSEQQICPPIRVPPSQKNGAGRTMRLTKSAAMPKEKDEVPHPTTNSKPMQYMGWSAFLGEGMKKGPACGFHIQDLDTP